MRDLLVDRTRRGVRRQVFRRRNRLVKRFYVPDSARRVHRDWEREHAALQLLGANSGTGSGTGSVLRERRVPGGQVVILERAWLEGCPPERLDPVRLAACLAALHGRGVIPLDPHPGNFLQRADGVLVQLDLGRAVIRRPGSPGHLLAVGRELYRVRRESFHDHPDAAAAYLQAYRGLRPRGLRWARLVAWLSGRGRALRPG